MTLSAPTDASDYNQQGVWDPNKVYTGPGGASGTDKGPNGQLTPADEVEYLGAYWISTYYTEGTPPSETAGTGWKLDTTGPGPNYNPVVPEAPTGLKAGYVSNSEVSLTWKPPVIEGEGEVSSYNVYENGRLVGTTTGTSYTAKGLTAGADYVFSVAASDQFGSSGTAAVWNYYHTYNYNIDPGANRKITVATASADVQSSGKYFSPYVDMTQPATDIQQISSVTKLRDFTLAFMQTNLSEIHASAVDPTTERPTAGVLAMGQVPTLSFGGLDATTLPMAAMLAEIKGVEAQGGTVTISVGGYTGFDPAVIATEYAKNLERTTKTQTGMSVADAQATAISNLAQEFQYVIDTYGVTSLDFDIENAKTVNSTLANQMRDLAIKQVEADNPGLSVSYTVATTPDGLASTPTSGGGDDLRVLQQAKHDGVAIDTVNIMTMDYFDGTTNMLAAAESAATAVEAQLTQLGLTAKIGITPMIGQNDDYGRNDAQSSDKVDEVFTLADARALEKWASTKSWVAGMGEWLLTRDQASTTDTTGQAPTETSSGVVQSQYQYTKLLEAIATMGGDSAAVAVAGGHTLVSSALVAAVSSVGPSTHYESARMAMHAQAV